MNLKDMVRKGPVISPLKIIIYGDNGVGKSTFAADSKNPVFLDLEGNIDHIDVPKYACKTKEEVDNFIDKLTTDEHSFNTLVIDSIDTLEQIIWSNICKKKEAESICDKRELGYGQGYTLAQEIEKKFLSNLNELRRKRAMNIILIGHQSVKKINNPEICEYDSFGLRIHEKFASIFQDWAHMILYASYDQSKISGKKDRIGFTEDKNKEGEDKRSRIMYTIGTSSIVAKNVFNLKQIMPLDWNLLKDSIASFYKKDKQEVTEVTEVEKGKDNE